MRYSAWCAGARPLAPPSTCTVAADSIGRSIAARFAVRDIREHKLTVLVEICLDLVTLEESSFENRERKWILNQSLNRSLERTRAKRRIVALLRQKMLRPRSELDCQLSLTEEFF